MKRYGILFAMLLGLAAFMFAQANSQTTTPQNSYPSAQTQSSQPDNDSSMNSNQQNRDSQATSTQTPDDSQDQNRDRDSRDQNRDRDSNQVNNQDQNRDQVYDRDQVYQQNQTRDQDRDRDQNGNWPDRNRNDNNRNGKDIDSGTYDRNSTGHDRDHDRNRVGTGGDVQSQIYSALQNNRQFSNVNVNVSGNRVDLTGTVPTGADRKEAVRVAQQYANGMKVQDHLKVSGRGNDRDRDDHK
jgi:osmotically-inducible protein OsmY